MFDRHVGCREGRNRRMACPREKRGITRPSAYRLRRDGRRDQGTAGGRDGKPIRHAPVAVAPRQPVSPVMAGEDGGGPDGPAKSGDLRTPDGVLRERHFRTTRRGVFEASRCPFRLGHRLIGKHSPLRTIHWIVRQDAAHPTFPGSARESWNVTSSMTGGFAGPGGQHWRG